MEEKAVQFNAKIIKQGNSACIRISKEILNYLDLGINDIVEVALERPSVDELPEYILKIYQKHMFDLKELTLEEIGECFNL
ncbi:MAG: hypothetical protein AABW92_02460, partial [Nanoarchaeota archaeon]